MKVVPVPAPSSLMCEQLDLPLRLDLFLSKKNPRKSISPKLDTRSGIFASFASHSRGSRTKMTFTGMKS